MVLLLHGQAGGWDELLIALVGVGVLWIAVKLAGRKPAAEDESEGEPLVARDADQVGEHPVPPSPTKLG